MSIKHDISAVILAGGRGKRMDNQDKGLLQVSGKPLVKWIIEAIEPKVQQIIISANRNLDIYSAYGFPVISDQLSNHQGPLAGVATALAHAKNKYLLTLPCDGPKVSPDLITRMLQSLLQHTAKIAVAHDGNREQSVYMLMEVACHADLQAFLDSGERKVHIWLKQQHAIKVDFSDQAGYFHNINQPQDLHDIQQLAQAKP